jgi:acyl-CoA thioesterase-1
MTSPVSLSPSLRALCVLLLAATVSGCHRSQPSATERDTVPAIDIGPPPKPTIVALGDSVTAGLGLLTSEAYPGLIETRLAKDGYDFDVENAGVSGDTTAGALKRMDWALTPNVKILIIALGGNDALRGLSPAQTHDNIAAIIQAARGRNIEVLVAGMEAPPNLGDDYKTAFHDAFARIAQENSDIAYVPFLLQGVAGKPELNQADGIHPNAAGANVVAATIYEKLKPLVDLVNNRGGGSLHE